eukprot:20211-Heterococcus_DN1.PRE.1
MHPRLYGVFCLTIPHAATDIAFSVLFHKDYAVSSFASSMISYIGGLPSKSRPFAYCIALNCAYKQLQCDVNTNGNIFESQQAHASCIYVCTYTALYTPVMRTTCSVASKRLHRAQPKAVPAIALVAVHSQVAPLLLHGMSMQCKLQWLSIASNGQQFNDIVAPVACCESTLPLLKKEHWKADAAATRAINKQSTRTTAMIASCTAQHLSCG